MLSSLGRSGAQPPFSTMALTSARSKNGCRSHWSGGGPPRPGALAGVHPDAFDSHGIRLHPQVVIGGEGNVDGLRGRRFPDELRERGRRFLGLGREELGPEQSARAQHDDGGERDGGGDDGGRGRFGTFGALEGGRSQMLRRGLRRWNSPTEQSWVTGLHQSPPLRALGVVQLLNRLRSSMSLWVMRAGNVTCPSSNRPRPKRWIDESIRLRLRGSEHGPIHLSPRRRDRLRTRYP